MESAAAATTTSQQEAEQGLGKLRPSQRCALQEGACQGQHSFCLPGAGPRGVPCGVTTGRGCSGVTKAFATDQPGQGAEGEPWGCLETCQEGGTPARASKATARLPCSTRVPAGSTWPAPTASLQTQLSQPGEKQRSVAPS